MFSIKSHFCLFFKDKKIFSQAETQAHMKIAQHLNRQQQ